MKYMKNVIVIFIKDVVLIYLMEKHMIIVIQCMKNKNYYLMKLNCKKCIRNRNIYGSFYIYNVIIKS